MHTIYVFRKNSQPKTVYKEVSVQSPFDTKNRLAAAIDRFSLGALVLFLSCAYFFFLWRTGTASLLAGGALFSLIALTVSLIERRTLKKRDLLLRQRLGAAIFLEELLLLPAGKARDRVLSLLVRALDADTPESGIMRYEGETWLVRLAQCMTGASAGAGDVLAAHRAREETGAQRCVLVSTTAFTAEAVRCAQWVDPPIRLIPGRQIAAVAGNLSPATDEEIAERARRRKRPFSRSRIRALAFSPAKTKRYLICSFLLMMLYFFQRSAASLIFMLASFVLAIFCHRENTKQFRL